MAYRMITSIEGLTVPATFAVVRGGTTVVFFASMAPVDPDEVEVPSEIIEAQPAKTTAG